jgi:cysteine desulfurase/selenocysteine lyase
MALQYKHLFPRATEVAYLDTAAEGLPAPGCCDAFSEYCTAKMQGTPGRVALQRMEDETLDLAARLLGTSKTNIAFLSSASEALYVLAGSINWTAGDEVIISDIEFPSNILPWLRLRKLGVRVIVIPADKGALDWQQVAERISPRTRLVSVSMVSYRTGAYLTGVAKLGAEVHRVGAHLAIDATQALGRCPVSIDNVDYLVASSFKWLMAPHGLGLVYLSPEFRDHLDPVSLGWYSVANAFASDRFERYTLKQGARCLSAGMPNYPSLNGLRRSLQFLLDIGPEVIYQELRPLVAALYAGFERLGYDLLTPKGADYASGIVAFSHSNADAIGAALAANGVVVWVGDGRVRASVHLYNDVEDVERCLRALESFANQQKTDPAPVHSAQRG